MILIFPKFSKILKDYHDNPQKFIQKEIIEIVDMFFFITHKREELIFTQQQFRLIERVPTTSIYFVFQTGPTVVLSYRRRVCLVIF